MDTKKRGDIEITEDYINIKRTFVKKNKKLAKKIPGFIYKFLERKIHQEELNRLLYKYKDKRDLEFLRAVILHEWKINIIKKNFDNLPKEGRFIVSSNHPLGGLDGVSLILAIGEKRTDIQFPVNDILMQIPTITDLFVPINKNRKKGSKENIDRVNQAFESDMIIPYFPAGMVSRKKIGKGIVDLDWKKSFIIGAKEFKRDIIPVHIEGRNSNKFYNLANFRKFIGVKANIEMLYLVDEMMKQKGNTISITFGKPISYKIFDDSRTIEAWADLMKAHCYNLQKEPNKIFQPN